MDIINSIEEVFWNNYIIAILDNAFLPSVS